MITLRIIAEQVGEHMTTTYYAEMDDSSTAREKEHIDLATNAIQKLIADKKGTGEFIERKALYSAATQGKADVPSEIYKKAQDVANWATLNGFELWEIGPVADRKLVDALRRKFR